MRQPRRMVAILSVSAAAIVSACAGNPKPDTVDPVTVSSTTRDTAPGTAPRTAVATDAGAAAPQTPPKGPLTLESAVQHAVSYHPSVVEAVSRLNQQGEAVNEARAGYRPRVSWGVNTNFDSREGDYRPSLDVSASQMIYDFGKVDGRVKIATAGIEGRKSQVLMAVDDLIRETAQAAIEVQRNKALAGVASDQVKDTSAILDLVKSRTQKGASTRSDELQAAARVQAAEATTLEVQAQTRRWTSALAALTGHKWRDGARRTRSGLAVQGMRFGRPRLVARSGGDAGGGGTVRRRRADRPQPGRKPAHGVAGCGSRH